MKLKYYILGVVKDYVPEARMIKKLLVKEYESFSLIPSTPLHEKIPLLCLFGSIF